MGTEWLPGSRGLFTAQHDLMLPVEDHEFLPPIPAQTHFRVLAVNQRAMTILLDEFKCGGRSWSGKAVLFRTTEGWRNMAGNPVPIQLSE